MGMNLDMVSGNAKGTQKWLVPHTKKKSRDELTPQTYLEGVRKRYYDEGGRSYRLRIGIGLKWKLFNFDEYKGDVMWFLSEMNCKVRTIDCIGRYLYVDMDMPTCFPRARWLTG